MLNRKTLLLLFLGAFTAIMLSGCSQPEEEPAPGNGAYGLETGAVVSSNEHATRAGKQVLEAGGNAVDAAIAVSFALNVAEPYGSGIGGGGFMLVYPADGEPVFIDYREKAPAAAGPGMFEDVTEQEKTKSGLAVAIPGQIHGMIKAHELFGSKDMAGLIEPAIKLAREGVTVTPVFADALSNYIMTSECEILRSTYLIDDIFPYQEGETLLQPPMEKLFSHLAENGLEAFYKDDIAQAIASVVQDNEGIMTADDLASYGEVRVTDPIRGEFGPYTLYTANLPSAGGIGVLQMLNIWQRYPYEIYKQPDYKEVAFLAHAMEIIFNDRETYIGDPAFADVPLADLLSEEYYAGKADTILNENLNFDVSPDREGSTTNFVTADSCGNLVVVTQTINQFFGSGLAVPEWGIFLNNQMGNFSSDPQSPNAPEGGKIPVSSMAPTIFVEDGEPVLAIGSPGARRLISAIWQVALNYLERGYTLQEAIDAPRFHYEGGELLIEEHEQFSAEDTEKLQEMGFKPVLHGIAGVTALGWDEDGPAGYADPRRGGDVFVK